MKTKQVNIVLTAILVASLFFIAIQTSSSGEYDPWIDSNDDGEIDIFDAINLASAFGTSGTPINKTALLLELEARIDLLNTTVIALQEQMTQLGSVKVLVGSHNDVTNAVTGRVTVWYNASHTNQFTNPPTIFVQAIDPATGNSKHGEIFSVGLDQFVVTISDSIGGSLFLDAGIDVTWIAIGPREMASQTKYCAGIDVLTADSSSQVTITFSGVTFANASNIHLSISGVVLSSATTAGSPLKITVVNLTTTYVTLALEGWSGPIWDQLAEDDEVQISYVAIEREPALATSSKECIVALGSKPYNAPTTYASGVGFVINVSSSIPSGFTLVSAFATGRKTNLAGTILDEPPLNLLPVVNGSNIEIRVWDAGGTEYDNWTNQRAHINYTLFITK